ncbi:hypothetical protein L2E81_24595 [Planktothrix agardhii 1033]|nr:hypothetical protein [Planktothrix agardhii 1033]
MGVLTWLEDHESAVSSLICCGGGVVALSWSVVNPGINPSRFYASGCAGLFGVGAIATAIKGLKEEERSMKSKLFKMSCSHLLPCRQLLIFTTNTIKCS